MHELSICQSLVAQLEGIALERNAQVIAQVTIGIGPLSGVEADLLKSAYPVASAGTIAESAELVVQALPIVVKCTQCGAESEVLANKLTCKHCGDWHTTLLSGDELLLMSVELEKTEEMTGEILH